MRVRHAAMVLGAVLAGLTTVQSAKAINLPIQTDLGLTEPSDLAFGFNLGVNWSVSEDGTTGHLTAAGPAAVFLFPAVTEINNPIFDVEADIDLTNDTVIGGHLEVSSNPVGPTIPGSSGTVYFYSNMIDGFAYDPSQGLVQFLFTQQDKPTTDTIFANIGDPVGVFVQYSAGVSGASPADTLSFPSGLGLAKAFAEPVPEPVTMVLAVLGLGAAGVSVIRRRRA